MRRTAGERQGKAEGAGAQGEGKEPERPEAEKLSIVKNGRETSLDELQGENVARVDAGRR